MSKILVFLQHANGTLQKASLAALRAAEELRIAWKKNAIETVSLGAGSEVAAKQASAFAVQACHHCSDASLNNFIAAAYADVITALAKQIGADTIVAAATSAGRDFMPRVAAVLEAGQASDIMAVNSDGTLRRPMYAGNVIADVEITTPVRCVSVRPTAFEPANPGQSSAPIVPFVPPAVSGNWGEVISYELSSGGRPELADAQIVVSGGRALQSAENFEKVIFPLADALGAAVGASRAAVDSGYAPNDWQVGQTGKVVAPQLYIAVGVSGAIQHIAGMKDSKVVVAINKDAEAPIFEVADYGLVADLFQAVPELTAAIRTLKSGS